MRSINYFNKWLIKQSELLMEGKNGNSSATKPLSHEGETCPPSLSLRPCPTDGRRGGGRAITGNNQTRLPLRDQASLHAYMFHA